MITESEMEDSVKESSGEMVGGPSAYLRYIPNVFGSVQKRGPVSEDGYLKFNLEVQRVPRLPHDLSHWQ